MTDVELLTALKARTEAATGDLLLPVRMQEADDQAPPPRAAAIYLVELPEQASSEKKTPYILHTVAEGTDKYAERVDGLGGRDNTRHLDGRAEVRSVFCVYAPDGQEGGLLLLTLMDRVRRDLLDYPTIGPFQLDLDAGLERTVYDSAEWELGPYHVGGLISRWIRRDPRRPEVSAILNGNTARTGVSAILGGGIAGTRDITMEKGAKEDGE